MSRLYASGRSVECLAGRSVLLIEHDFNDARDVKQALQHAGARVLGPFKDYDAASQVIADSTFSCAIVTLTLSEDVRSLVPLGLAEKGVPCIWVTPAKLPNFAKKISHTSVLQKPIDLRELVKLAAALSEGRTQVEAVTGESRMGLAQAVS